MAQITKRKIGAVDIIDLRGEFVGPWALRGKDEIAAFIRNHKTKNLLINLRGLSTVDSLGVKAITENLSDGIRSGFITGNLSVMEMFSRIPTNNLRFFKNEDEIIHYFGEDLVKWQEHSYEEKRKFQRLKTAVSLDFFYEEKKGEPVYFRSVVTDLSEGGLYAEYLDLDESSYAKFKLNPNDFPVLTLKIKLPGLPPIQAEGKVVRTIFESNQVAVGVEFTEIAEADKFRINNFLSRGQL